MPGLNLDTSTVPEPRALTRLPFKPISRSHILHCSYDYWHPMYSSSALKSIIISLDANFLTYLRSDGIILPPESYPHTGSPRTIDSEWPDDSDSDPTSLFTETHNAIKAAIEELGGSVAPKLNWSAPKDATWIMMKKNSMECTSASDIYLILKSSDFITHDLEHVFDDCAADPRLLQANISYVLVLRKWFKVNPACEFRCFVRQRRLIGICQRDLNHFDFLFAMVPNVRSQIQSYFDQTLRSSFPEDDFVFDVYLPEPHIRVRLMDINPWAPRTDPLLFSWLELLTMPLPMPLLGIPDTTSDSVVSTSDDDIQDEETETWQPEVRLVHKDDPEAYSFNTPQYSAHKLPRDVVLAGMSGESSMRDFAHQWKQMVDGEIPMQTGYEDEDSDTE